MRRVCALFGGLSVLVASSGAQGTAASQVRPQPQRVASPTDDIASKSGLITKYCVPCHNERTKAGGLMLDRMDLAQIGAGAATWEKVVRKLRGGMMPPQGMPRPDQATLEGFASALETSLEREAMARPNPGRASLRRLNRTEYANAVRDL